uniref:Uncharacterized protein n=1 Tax=Tetranychus urticae TaxID=32264 RepID=T1KD08_TETUR
MHYHVSQCFKLQEIPEFILTQKNNMEIAGGI